MERKIKGGTLDVGGGSFKIVEGTIDRPLTEDELRVLKVVNAERKKAGIETEDQYAERVDREHKTKASSRRRVKSLTKLLMRAFEGAKGKPGEPYRDPRKLVPVVVGGVVILKKVKGTERCPCGSERLYKNCHKGRPLDGPPRKRRKKRRRE